MSSSQKGFVSMSCSQMEQTCPSIPSNYGNGNLRISVNSPYVLQSSTVNILRDNLCYKKNTWLQEDKNIHSVLPDQKAGAGQGILHCSEMTAKKEKTVTYRWVSLLIGEQNLLIGNIHFQCPIQSILTISTL